MNYDCRTRCRTLFLHRHHVCGCNRPDRERIDRPGAEGANHQRRGAHLCHRRPRALATRANTKRIREPGSRRRNPRNPDHGGKLAPTLETVIETSRTAPNTAQTRRDVFRFSPDGRRTLVEATESRQETLANGDSRAIHDTSAPDLNGRLSSTSRQIEETRSPAPDVREIHTTLLEPDLNGTLQATERTEYTERPINPGLLRHDSTQLVRDINGRWQPIEARRGEVRDISASERTEEETIQRLDMNQKLAVTERSVTRRSSANGREQVVIEIYAPYTDGSSRLVLSERVHRTTTPTADGGRYTVEEVEGRSNVAPDDPLRVTRRTVTTVRKSRYRPMGNRAADIRARCKRPAAARHQ